MKRAGKTHYFRSLHYLLVLACDHHPAADAQRLHFTTHWSQVTCEACRKRKPLTPDEQKLIGFQKGQ